MFVNLFVGTIAFMAPEVIFLLENPDVPYDFSVDSWSLGVLMYKLLTGKYPFKPMLIKDLKLVLPLALKKYPNDRCRAFHAVFGNLSFEMFQFKVSDVAKDMIDKLLVFGTEDRLSIGSDLLLRHPYFDGIDWSQIEAKTSTPPYIPVDEAKSYATSTGSESETVVTFDEIMCSSGKLKWLLSDTGVVSPHNILEEKQDYFSEWDFVAPQAVCEENEKAVDIYSFPGTVSTRLSDIA